MLFKKRNKEKTSATTTSVQDRLAGGIAQFLLSLQNLFAKFMSKKINRLSTKFKKLLLAMFSIVCMASIIYALTDVFKPLRNNDWVFPSYPSTLKKTHKVSPVYSPEPTIRKSEIIRIEHFKNYMDSLNQSDSGKMFYQSILKSRPGLMDSIKIIEEFYSSQSK